MRNTAKKLSDVFGNLDLTSHILSGLGMADIEKIVINKQSKKMNVHMQLPNVVNESLISDLSRQLRQNLPNVNEVDIHISYHMEGRDLSKKILSGWPNILDMVGRQSPLCMSILKQANWEVINDKLLIKVKNNGSFLFALKGLDKKIQSYVDSRFKETVWVQFEDEKDASGLPVMTTLPAPAVPAEPPFLLSGQNNPKPETKTEPPKTVSPSVASAAFSPPYQGARKGGRSRIKYKKIIKADRFPISDEMNEDEIIVIEGRIFDTETRETKSGRLLTTLGITDGNNSVSVKFFAKPHEYTDEIKALVKKGMDVVIRGKVQYDEYAKELNIMANEISQGAAGEKRMDNAPVKRVELHLHTQMSAMDAIEPAKAYIKKAAEWGHKAIAITDHGVVQAFPEAMEAAKAAGIKVIYGMEAYLIDDLGAIVQCPGPKLLDDTIVVFDLETTGLQAETDKIIEIGAVKIESGKITDRYGIFVNPGVDIPQKITDLTGITGDMVASAPTIDEVLPGFLQFVGNHILAAHNAGFDVGFLSHAAKELHFDIDNTVLDTLELSRLLFPELNKHKLNLVAEHLGISLENHHRAVDDAAATGEIFLACRDMLKKKGIFSLQDINILASSEYNKSKLKSAHAIILAQNETGLRNLYELVSKAHINYFYRRPRIPKSEFLQKREGLLIGSACESGELYKAVRDNKPAAYIRELALFYDYFEIQPIGNNMYLLRNGKVPSVQTLIDINKSIVDLGEKYDKPVVATCDVHFMNPEDEVYRRIIMSAEGFKDADNQAPLYFRTTEEMLSEFDYLPRDTAKAVVIDNPNAIADRIESIKPIPDETFPPIIEGAEEHLQEITMKRAREQYGEELPALVSERLDKELNSIIKNGFAVMYIIAQKLVSKSMEDGYLVGSRGSVGSSLVATMSGITEVNPLPPHYLCLSCHYSDFDSPTVKEYAGGSGCDMPDASCPVCGADLNREGHDIPFETFLGFDCDKEPDIDLNFSGEYQAKAHAYTEELFGEGYVFKAGTIGTLADKTAYSYVIKYFEERDKKPRQAEINRLKSGCTGIKRTTGQHPGGLMILPAGHSIYEFCPVQRPANDTKSTVTTTHFDYHSISGRLLKLDLLGHDVPTIIRMLHDITGIDPTTVPLSDKKVMSLFVSPEALGVTAEAINCKTGSLGLPEFGTGFVRQMLLDTQPTTFAELVRISGLSHGTDVWLNNAQTLIQEKTATLKEVIPSRDDIMLYLIKKGVEKKMAFKIMESVRKGKGVTDTEISIMEEHDVPDWYIDSCQKIKYLFPKGHAVAYVIMTVRIGYFKLYHPYSFYAASLSVKAEEFDYEIMCHGIEEARRNIGLIVAMGKDATAKDKNMLTLLELVVEMYARGLRFAPLHLYEAEASKFRVTPDGLMPPLCSVPGLGVSVAQNIVESRKDGEFFTIEDFRQRTKTNKTVIELLKKHDVLRGIPETDQLTLF